MDVSRAVQVGSYALATVVLLSVALLVRILDVLPFPNRLAKMLANASRVSEATLTLLLFVGLPLVLTLTLAGRAFLMTTPAEIVLAAFAVPCLLVSVWALYSYVFTSPGIYWGTC